MRFPFLLWGLSLLCVACTSRTQAPPLDDSPSPIVPDTLNLLFVGDVMQHRPQTVAARTANGYDFTACFQEVSHTISKADFAIANLECPLGGKPYTGYPLFSAPDELALALKEAGFDILVTANNHCMDRGEKGMKRTIALIDSLNLMRTGTYLNEQDQSTHNPLILQKGRMRVALLSYTYGTNGLPLPRSGQVHLLDSTLIKEHLHLCRSKQVDAILVYLHWGEEYQRLPNRNQRQWADWLLTQGVDHIIGSHPHVVQPVEMRTDSIRSSKHLIAYSLGNFISNQPFPHTDGGIMLRMQLIKNETGLTQPGECTYSMVWTARPAQTGRRNYCLLPGDFKTDSLPASAQRAFDAFTRQTREHLLRHNIGVVEKID